MFRGVILNFIILINTILSFRSAFWRREIYTQVIPALQCATLQVYRFLAIARNDIGGFLFNVSS